MFIKAQFVQHIANSAPFCSKISCYRKNIDDLVERDVGKNNIMGDPNVPFWKTKTLGEMSRSEWESLCDGCGRCCLVKLEDEDTLKVHYTMASCALLDVKSCRCSDYENRAQRMPDCVELTNENLPEMDWLPPTCAYRRLSEGGELSWWHPLVSGSVDTVHEAGISVRGKIVSETHIAEEDLWGATVTWPLEDAD